MKYSFDQNLYTKKVDVENLKAGDYLVNDIYLKEGVLVARAGSLLTETQLELLKRMRDKVVTLDVREVYKKGVAASRKMFSQAAADQAILLQDVEDFVQPFMEQVEREPSITELLHKLQSKDEYTFQHTVNIGVLSITIGKWMGLKAKDLRNLILAGTLHDIGKSKIPTELINKPGRLTADEYELMKKHTLFGREILEKSDEYDESVKLAVLQHHERIDGTGYPKGLKGNEIHLYSRIVAVADVYHALTSVRVYKGKVTPLVALDYLERNMDTMDAQVILIFVEKMLSSLQSCRVLLNNNVVCDIVYIDRRNIVRPLLKMADEDRIIELQKREDLDIVDMIYDDN